jgi:dynein light chain LC8-type
MLTSNEKSQEQTTKRGQEKVLILETDMSDDMLKSALDIVEEIYQSNFTNQEIAEKLKEKLEYKYYPTWMCIVGKSFGCKINAQKNHYLCFKIENKTIIIYKYH